MRIGIMGGTFDPIHNGHLVIAQTAFEQFHLDEIWFMPNGHPPHKNQTEIGSTPKMRADMAALAIEGHKSFRLETYETDKGSVSCSYETMEYFKSKYPDHTFYFIIGADSLFTLESWVHPERLFPTCTILAAYRDEKNTKEEMYRQIDYLKRKYGASIELLISPLVPISSSDIRKLCREGKDIREYVPEKVEKYIIKEGLYESENRGN